MKFFEEFSTFSLHFHHLSDLSVCRETYLSGDPMGVATPKPFAGKDEKCCEKQFNLNLNMKRPVGNGTHRPNVSPPSLYHRVNVHSCSHS